MGSENNLKIVWKRGQVAWCPNSKSTGTDLIPRAGEGLEIGEWRFEIRD